MMRPEYSELKDEDFYVPPNRNSPPTQSSSKEASPTGIADLPSNLDRPQNITNNIQTQTLQNNIMTENTLDEPVSVTIKRDLLNIWNKLKMVLFPKGNKDLLKDWDLWGPLVLCLALSICLAASAPSGQAPFVFTFVFVVVWVGSAVVTVNGKLLGGKISFFQSVCVLGYCVFPLVIASIVGLFVPFLLIKGLVVLGAFIWSFTASIGFLGETNLENRKMLATYPIFLFYFILSWVILISKSIV